MKSMKTETKNQNLIRKVTPLERGFRWAPYAIVAVIARIKGTVLEEELLKAVSKVQQRHLYLRVRVVEDKDNIPWFTSEEIKEIPVKVYPRESSNHWMDIYHQECKVPFKFDETPAIRFLLVQSDEISELIILCHHTICDGMSLAYLARDLLIHLGNPAKEVEVLDDPQPMLLENIPKEVKLNRIIKFLVNRRNKQWPKDEIYFDQTNYEDLNEAYWNNYTHKMISVELSEEETSKLVKKCRLEGITVTSALTAAFVGAQRLVQGEKPHQSMMLIAGNLRQRLIKPVGEVVGFYAGGAVPKFNYNPKDQFWDNARTIHKKLQPLYSNKKLFEGANIFLNLEPALRESATFKVLSELVPSTAPSYQKLSSFSKRDDITKSFLKRRKMDTLDNIVMGTAVTNLTRLDFPANYGKLVLDRLIMNPGSSASLGNVNLVLGAVTCVNKLSLILEYAEETVDSLTMEAIRKKALELLLEHK
jgi:NRPS condensation-like uncharacterized protein